MEHGECAEVAAVDGAPVPAAPRRKGLPGPHGEGPVRHERGGVPPALAAVRRHAARPPGHMEVRCVWHVVVYVPSDCTETPLHKREYKLKLNFFKCLRLFCPQLPG